MDRLATDNPDGNFQTMMNLAYAKDGEVWLRGGKNGDVKLFEVLARSCSDFCDPPNENLAEAYTDCLTGYDDVCAVALLFAVATQAAEMRGRLQDYEDLGTVEELAALKEATTDARLQLRTATFSTNKGAADLANFILSLLPEAPKEADHAKG